MVPQMVPNQVSEDQTYNYSIKVICSARYHPGLVNSNSVHTETDGICSAVIKWETQAGWSVPSSVINQKGSMWATLASDPSGNRWLLIEFHPAENSGKLAKSLATAVLMNIVSALVLQKHLNVYHAFLSAPRLQIMLDLLSGSRWTRSWKVAYYLLPIFLSLIFASFCDFVPFSGHVTQQLWQLLK